VKRLALLALLLTSSSLVAAPAPFARPERRPDLERVQGEWEVVKDTQCVWSGRTSQLATVNVAPDPNVNLVYVLREQWVTRVFGYAGFCSSIKFAEGKIDMVNAEDRTIRRGVYTLTGDTLTICLAPCGADRPTSLAVNQGGYSGYVLRRKR
jgi:hypothetical protein